MSEMKRLVLTTIATILLAYLTGLFLVGDLASSTPSELQQYDVRTTTNQTQTFVVHTHNELSVHEHKITTIVKTTETTPHGHFHDMASLLARDTTAAQAISGVPQGPTEIWVIAREFKPMVMTVPVGTTVTWTNKDFEEHTVTFNNGLINSRLITRGDSFSYTFAEPGTFDYYCDPHKEMRGQLIVK